MIRRRRSDTLETRISASQGPSSPAQKRSRTASRPPGRKRHVSGASSAAQDGAETNSDMDWIWGRAVAHTRPPLPYLSLQPPPPSPFRNCPLPLPDAHRLQRCAADLPRVQDVAPPPPRGRGEARTCARSQPAWPCAPAGPRSERGTGGVRPFLGTSSSSVTRPAVVLRRRRTAALQRRSSGSRHLGPRSDTMSELHRRAV